MMRFNLLIIAVLFGGLTPVYAADDVQENDSNHEWTVGISGGVSVIENSSNQQFGSLSLNKDFGDSYAGLSVTYVDSGRVQGLITSVPASTTELSLSAGASFDALTLDGYVSFGRRSFDVESTRRDDQVASIVSKGEAFGVGGAISYDIALTDYLFLTPAISADYNQLDIVSVAQAPNGEVISAENNEGGLTGTFGLALQRIFGSQSNHLVSLFANLVTTSNTTSFNPGTSQSTALRVLARRDQPGQKDSWGEAGVALSFAVSDSLRLDMSALQTIGFLNSDATSLSAGLRYSF